MARGSFTCVRAMLPSALDVIHVCGPPKFTELVMLNNSHRSHPSQASPPLHNVEELLIERGLATVRCFTVRGWSRLTTAYGASSRRARDIEHISTRRDRSPMEAPV